MPDHGGAGDAARSESAAVLWELAASGVEVDGRLQVGASTWFVYGHTSYDGEVVIGRYEHAVDAEEALRCAPPPRTGPAGPASTSPPARPTQRLADHGPDGRARGHPPRPRA